MLSSDCKSSTLRHSSDLIHRLETEGSAVTPKGRLGEEGATDGVTSDTAFAEEVVAALKVGDSVKVGRQHEWFWCKTRSFGRTHSSAK